jgi:hypothetical protein
MDFVKFVWLLDRASLYFTRVDQLGDRFEGSMSRANLKARDTMDPRVIDAGRPELLRRWEHVRRTLPQYHYVNCWTLSGYESVAMWRLYVGDGNGVAIQSTFRSLAGATYAADQSQYRPASTRFDRFVSHRAFPMCGRDDRLALLGSRTCGRSDGLGSCGRGALRQLRLLGLLGLLVLLGFLVLLPCHHLLLDASVGLTTLELADQP